MGVHATAWVWRSEDNIVELVLFFDFYIDAKDWTQVSRLVQQKLFLLAILLALHFILSLYWVIVL